MSSMKSGENCLLTRYLDDMSSEEGGRKAQFAGALYCGLGYPSFNMMSPDITLIVQILQSIKNAGQTDLLSEVAEKCSHCPLGDSCGAGALFKLG